MNVGMAVDSPSSKSVSFADVNFVSGDVVCSCLGIGIMLLEGHARGKISESGDHFIHFQSFPGWTQMRLY